MAHGTQSRSQFGNYSDATWRTELHTPQGVPSTKGPGSRRYRPYRFASETRALTLSTDRVTRKFIDARENAVESELSSSREMGTVYKNVTVRSSPSIRTTDQDEQVST
eukprot:180364_1